MAVVAVVAVVAVTAVAVVLVASITMSLTAIPMDAHAIQHTLVFHVNERSRATTTLQRCTTNWAVALDGVLPRPDRV